MTAAPTIDEDFLLRYPHLLSPAHLMMAHLGEKCMMPRHLWKLNELLVRTLTMPNGRLAVNMPFQHGKTWMSSNFGIAWALLMNPHWRIIAVAMADTWCENKIGAVVKGIIERWGPRQGIRLKRDTKAKGEWVIDGYEGGLVCCGRDGQIVGRPADAVFLDDLIKNNEEALSPTTMDKCWSLWETVIFSRLGPTAPVVSVGTRWGRRDWFGRIKEQARVTGEPWEFVVWPALAKTDDPLGRKEGEALWPERVPLARLEAQSKKEGHWFECCWQQNPVADDGTFFKPKNWLRYDDFGNQFCIQREGQARKLIDKRDCTIIVAADWAYSVKETGDCSAIGAAALTPDGDLLLLEVLNERLKPDQLAPELANVCRKWRPRVVGVEDGHPTLKQDVLRFREIPEVQWLTPQGKDKINRAIPAIQRAGNGKVLLPSKDGRLERPWLYDYVTQLAAFSVTDDGPATDDMVDMTSWLCVLAEQYRPLPSNDFEAPDYSTWAPLTPGRDSDWKKYPW